MDQIPGFGEDAAREVERLRLEWLALVGPSRLAQQVSHSEVAAWWAWTRWQAAKADLPLGDSPTPSPPASLDQPLPPAG
ncbi:MAG: hypothetical protein ACREN4_06605 [Candidatus Dormibacteria bacterium]